MKEVHLLVVALRFHSTCSCLYRTYDVVSLQPFASSSYFVVPLLVLREFDAVVVLVVASAVV